MEPALNLTTLLAPGLFGLTDLVLRRGAPNALLTLAWGVLWLRA